MLWRTAPGYLVLAGVDGRYVEVEGPGCDIWVRLTEWIAEDELSTTVARQYGADEQVVSPDVRSLLHELHAQGYVDRAD